jgi:uncharacterized protein YjiS (DUF1127 family)
MTYATQALSHVPTSSASQLLGGFLKREWEAYRARRARRATVHALRNLDDATLRDIGLGRSEIESVVYGTPGDRRQRYDDGR